MEYEGKRLLVLSGSILCVLLSQVSSPQALLLSPPKVSAKGETSLVTSVLSSNSR